MLLLPALALLLSLSLGLFQIGVDRISLEIKAFEAARANAIGLSVNQQSDIETEISAEGRLECVKLRKLNLIPIEATSCMIPYGG